MTTRGRARRVRGRQEKERSPANVWSGIPRAAADPRHRADPVRRPAPAGPRPLAREQRQGVQEGRQRAEGRHGGGEEGRREEGVGRFPLSPPRAPPFRDSPVARVDRRGLAADDRLPRSARRSRAGPRAGGGDAPLALALPGPHALQLGRGAVRARPARVRHREAPAAPAGLPALRGPRAAPQRLPRGSHARLRGARDPVQRRLHLRPLPSRAPPLRPLHRGGGRVAARGEPALLVLRLGRAHLRGGGLRGLGGGVVRLRDAAGTRALALLGRARPRARGRHAAVGAGAPPAARTRRGRHRHPVPPAPGQGRSPAGRRGARVAAADAVADRRPGRLPGRFHPALRLGAAADLGAGRLARDHPGPVPLPARVDAGGSGAALPRRARGAVLRAARGLATAGVVPARLDRAARRLLHADPLRTGRLRADLPARAGHPPEPRAHVVGGRGLGAAAASQLALGAHHRGPAAAGPHQHRVLRERAPAAARVRPA